MVRVRMDKLSNLISSYKQTNNNNNNIMFLRDAFTKLNAPYNKRSKKKKVK